MAVTIEQIVPVARPYQEANGWGDQVRYLVSGHSGSYYDAHVALNAAGKGYAGAHPVVPGLVGRRVQYVGPVTTGGAGDMGYAFDVTYGPPELAESDPNPLNWAVRYQLRYGFYPEKADQDKYGNTLVNSAGDPFDPPETTDKLCIYLSCTAWRTGFDLGTALEYMDHVNEWAVTICGVHFEPRCVLCRNYAPAGEFTRAASPLAVGWEFELRTDTFDRKILDRGFQSWFNTQYVGGPTSNKKGKLIMFGTVATPPAQPALLNGEGCVINATNSTYSVQDPKFDAFANAGTDQLPDYVRNGIITLTGGVGGGGGKLLPYRFKKQADFQHFEDIGL